MKKIAKILCAGSLILGGISGVLIPASVYAADPFCDGSLTEEAKKAAGCSNGEELTTVITNILKAVIGVAGFVAVVFVVIGGVQYMTSTGDPSKVKKAKDTILYALIGLVICALAFAIVNWTVGVINGSSSEEAETTQNP